MAALRFSYRDRQWYAVCDVCGFRYHAYELTPIKDKYNELNNLLVCKYDRDKTNGGNLPWKFRERIIGDPRFIRPGQPDQFVTNENDSTSPSAPKNLTIVGVTSSSITLTWYPADEVGTSGIKGYKIERESPVGGGFATIVEDTQSVALTYKDVALSTTTQYNYRVSAINGFGTGNASNEAQNTTI